MTTCAACGKTAGEFQRVTYRGAPDGGIPVHTHCLDRFYEDLERRQWKRDVAAEVENVSRENEKPLARPVVQFRG